MFNFMLIVYCEVNDLNESSNKVYCEKNEFLSAHLIIKFVDKYLKHLLNETNCYLNISDYL